MEFNEKLQMLRKQKELTQEQLAEQLYVSRTAVSKWESGKGYPSIESLKCIAKFFDVTIDELLSGEELINIAVTENRSNVSKLFGYINAVIDIMAVIFIFLPLYGQPNGSHIQAVNLIEYTNNNYVTLVIFWMIFITFIILGIVQLFFIQFDNEKWCGRMAKISFIIDSLAIILFAATREPYITALLFVFFFIKVIIRLKEKQSKKTL